MIKAVTDNIWGSKFLEKISKRLRASIMVGVSPI